MIRVEWNNIAQVKQEFDHALSKVAKTIEDMRQAYRKGYATEYAFMHLPFDQHLIKCVMDARQRIPNISCALVIGIGGSSLGTRAVHDALNGLLYNELTDTIPLYFAESIDPDYIFDLYHIIEQKLAAEESVVLIVVSKSGTTIETRVNFAVFEELLKQYKPQTYAHYIVVITNEDSALAHIAKNEGYQLLTIPDYVGGRYSVLSAASLFPLLLVGVDIEQLHAGAAHMIEQCLEENMDNPAMLSAFFIFYWYSKGYNIHDSFFFYQQCESLGKWYRQLMAESLGKESVSLKKVGITPTISIGTTDLHSIAQLHLGGPYDKSTTFISCKKYHHDVLIPEGLARLYKNNSMAYIMQATLKGVIGAYEQDNRPFITVEIDELTAYSLGQLLQCYMIQMVYLGTLLEVNPFNQPHVELYKKKTRALLE